MDNLKLKFWNEAKITQYPTSAIYCRIDDIKDNSIIKIMNSILTYNKGGYIAINKQTFDSFLSLLTK